MEDLLLVVLSKTLVILQIFSDVEELASGSDSLTGAFSSPGI